MDARLGVTGKGYGAHGLSGRRPIANSFLPVTVEKGLDPSVSVCAVKLPDPSSAIGHDGEGAAAWGACRPFELLVNVVVVIIDVSMRGSANRRDLILDGVDSYFVSKIFVPHGQYA